MPGTKDSNLLANPALSPPTMNDPGTVRGQVFVAQDNFAVVATDIEVGDIIRLARLPTNARVLSIRLTATVIGGILADVGIYTKAGAVKDVDAFASAFTLDGALLTEVVDEAATTAQRELIGDSLWEWAGDTVDPNDEYDICLTVTTSGAPAPGTIGFQIFYTVT